LLKENVAKFKIDRVTNIRFLTFDTAAGQIYPFIDELIHYFGPTSDISKALSEEKTKIKLWILSVVWCKLEIPYLQLMKQHQGNIRFNIELRKLLIKGIGCSEAVFLTNDFFPMD